MENTLLLVIVFLSFFDPFVEGELYSSLVGLEQLVETQKVILKVFEKYLETSEARLKQIAKLKHDYARLLEVSGRDFPNFVSNPINAFVLIKKLTVDWKKAQKLMFIESQEKDIRKGLKEWDKALFPDGRDLSGAAQALIRLQDTYDLNMSSLVEGRLRNTSANFNLTANDCFEMGRQAFHAGFYDHSISWLEMANTKMSEEGNITRQNSTLAQILKYLAMSTFQKGKKSALEFTQSLLRLGHMVDEELKKLLQVNITANEGDFESFARPLDEVAYQKLCRSSRQQKSMNSGSSHLKCKIVANHPYLILHPVQEEEMWLDPKVSVYYNVFSDREIETMKELAIPKLVRGEVAEYGGGKKKHSVVVTEYRVTKIAWLFDNDHSTVPIIYRRIEDITGLSTTSAEPVQVANYGLGGHFHLHTDEVPESGNMYGENIGGRIATWLAYLNDVDEGGATVFPRLNLTVWPTKGSALYWHNLKSNGDVDLLTLHGACPVVTGTKWVTNIWLHERGQEFRLRCGKKPDSSMLQMHGESFTEA